MRSSSVPQPRRGDSGKDDAVPEAAPVRTADRVGLPYAEESSPDETYADASRLARRYPLRPLPYQAVADKLLNDARWQQICEEISSHGALDRHYLD